MDRQTYRQTDTDTEIAEWLAIIKDTWTDRITNQQIA